MPKRAPSSSTAPVSPRRVSAGASASIASTGLRAKMPLFSEHISNMYYSGTPSYISSPYSYTHSSSFTPLTTSYSASYLNPGASYSNHSSLGYSRTLTSRWIPSNRSYSPMLSTISERGTSTPVRVNSPRRIPIQSRSNRSYVSAYSTRPVNINTADIDVSRNKYKDRISTASDVSSQLKKENSTAEQDKNPLNSRIEDKPETGIDTSPGIKRGTIKRDRTVVRLHTLKRKERDSPRKPVEELQNKNESFKMETEVNQQENNEEPVERKRWREKLSDDLVYKKTKEKKTLGAKLIEKFQIKNKDSDTVNDTTSALNRQQNLVKIPPVEQNTIVNSKSLDRRCSMELLAEQACLLDSLIRKENLSTATLDLSKIGADKNEPNNRNSSKEESKNNFLSSENVNPLTTTKSDHSLQNMLNKLKDQKHQKRRSVKKSASGGNISKLNSITEITKDLSDSTLPVIDESRQSLKDVEQNPKPKPLIKTKITSTVEITPPSSPLRFKVENITVDEKPRSPKKGLMFSSEIETVTVESEHITDKNSNETTVPISPEPEDGNFWNKIGKRETVYLMTRKQKLAKAKEDQKKSLFWYPEEECESSENICENKENSLVNLKNNQAEDQNFRTKINEKDVNRVEKADQSHEKVKSTNPQAENINKADCDIVSLSKGSPEIEVGDKTLMPKKDNKQLPTVIQTVDKTTTLNTRMENKDNINNLHTPNSVNSLLKQQSINKENLVSVQLENNADVNIKTVSGDSSVKDVNTKAIKNEVCDIDQNKKASKGEKPKKVKKVSQKKKCELSNKLSTDTKNNENTTDKMDPIDNQNKTIIEHSDVKPQINESNQLFVEENILKEGSYTDNLEETGKKSLQDVNSRISITNKQDDVIELHNKNLEESLCISISLPDQSMADLLRPLEKENIPNNIVQDEKVEEVSSSSNTTQERDTNEINSSSHTTQEKSTIEISNSFNTTHENETQYLKRTSVKQKINTEPLKAAREQKALKPLIATPRPLQKKVPRMIHSSSSSETSSDDETSDDDEDEEESSESESSGEFFDCDNPDGRTSTGSNDSGFDSSASTSPAGFMCVRKGGDCPSTSAGIVPAQTVASNILEQELEQSTAYGLFRKTGRFTPPARSIPRFRKYTIEDFQFIKVLGKGSFGKVLLAELRDTEYYYAVKCLKKDVVLEDDDVECTLIERKVLALGTNHPYLCHLFATFQTDSHLFFVMEYLNGGDLMFHIQQSGRFPEPRARFYAAEIVSGLKFLHKRGIIYRDLKLDNILLDFDGHVRIADFGMCKLQIYLDKTADTFCGTPDYMAPEIIKGLKYNQAVDWWSFGVLLYEMLIGQSPFSGCDEDELFWSICNEMPSYPRFLSQEALSILTRLLDKDARTRLGGAECMHGDIRDQDFFHPVAWDRLERRELDAPFKPRVRHPLDTQYFDRAFTGERPRLTAVEPHVLRSMDQEPFRGFSYTNPNATDR